VRIIGEYGGDSTVSAEFDLTTFKRSTSDFWLTILPKKEKEEAQDKK